MPAGRRQEREDVKLKNDRREKMPNWKRTGRRRSQDSRREKMSDLWE
jgi:hypothetical protein